MEGSSRRYENQGKSRWPIAHCQLVIANCFAGSLAIFPAKQLAMTNWQWSMA
jgi:hypothetical protein